MEMKQMKLIFQLFLVYKKKKREMSRNSSLFIVERG